jgi:hypothetical protein
MLAFGGTVDNTFVFLAFRHDDIKWLLPNHSNNLSACGGKPVRGNPKRGAGNALARSSANSGGSLGQGATPDRENPWRRRRPLHADAGDSPARKAAAESIGLQPLLYHSGGSVMSPVLQIYGIFWGPTLLQNGTPTPLFSPIRKVLGSVGASYGGHGLMNLATQYFQTIGGVTTYIQISGGLAGFFIDKSPLPPSGCTDSATPRNCITDAQVQAEITSAMTKNGWTGGLNKIFVLFTPNGEGSCFDSTSAMCAYIFYCAYHGFFTSGGQTIIYANLPYANTSVCKAPGQTEPNGDVGDWLPVRPAMKLRKRSPTRC